MELPWKISLGTVFQSFFKKKADTFVIEANGNRLVTFSISYNGFKKIPFLFHVFEI